MSSVSSKLMAPQQNSAETLIDYWKPDLVREAAQIALKTPWHQMENVMVQATEFMEQLPWKGVKTTGLQSLAWPRTGVLLKDGTRLPETEIPESIRECSIKVSYFIAAGVPFDIPALTHVILTIGHLLIPGASVKKESLTSW